MKGKNPIACTNEASCVTFNDFAGNSNDNYSKVCYGYDKGSWIIDTGDSAHRCNSLDLFDKTSRIFFKNTVILPNRTNKSVAHIDIVILSPSLSLTEVLYIPTFKYNLHYYKTIRNYQRKFPLVKTDILLVKCVSNGTVTDLVRWENSRW